MLAQNDPLTCLQWCFITYDIPVIFHGAFFIILSAPCMFPIVILAVTVSLCGVIQVKCPSQGCNGRDPKQQPTLS